MATQADAFCTPANANGSNRREMKAFFIISAFSDGGSLQISRENGQFHWNKQQSVFICVIRSSRETQ